MQMNGETNPMTTITLNLSDELYTKLQAQASQHSMALEAYILSALSDVTNDDELTDEEILANLKQAFLEAIHGEEGRPIHELLDELDQEVGEYADQSHL